MFEHKPGIYVYDSCGESLLAEVIFIDALRKEGSCTPKELKLVSLNKGKTTTIKSRSRIYLKLNYINPTGTFKGRGATTAGSEA